MFLFLLAKYVILINVKETVRINKYISSTGLCSRRKAEEYIEHGLVTINGTKALLTSTVNKDDEVRLNGEVIEPKKECIVLLFNKPRGITCTTERHIKGNIIDYINYPERIFPIGRLDKDSRGLILLTNDGDLVNECLRVENGHEKEYIVKVDKAITDEFIVKMSKGVRIFNPVSEEYVITLPCKIKKISEDSFNITLKQGYNRQIRRMCKELGYKVKDLQRIRFMHLSLDIQEGKYRLLNEEEIEKFNKH